MHGLRNILKLTDHFFLFFLAAPILSRMEPGPGVTTPPILKFVHCIVGDVIWGLGGHAQVGLIIHVRVRVRF